MNNERTLKTWNKANDLPTPTNTDLMKVRSFDCEPRFIGANVWETPSATRHNVFYSAEVYFAGFTEAASHGLSLHIECGCPAKGMCKHQLRIANKYEANWSYLFDLFNLSRESSFSQLWDKVSETFERLKCELCNKPSNGEIHPACHDYESYLADKQAA